MKRLSPGTEYAGDLGHANRAVTFIAPAALTGEGKLSSSDIFALANIFVGNSGMVAMDTLMSVSGLTAAKAVAQWQTGGLPHDDPIGGSVPYFVGQWSGSQGGTTIASPSTSSSSSSSSSSLSTGSIVAIVFGVLAVVGAAAVVLTRRPAADSGYGSGKHDDLQIQLERGNDL